MVYTTTTTISGVLAAIEIDADRLEKPSSCAATLNASFFFLD
jgi:hypothetical protein